MYSNNKEKLYLTNIFIIDWDDTLFPTSWVHSNNINLLNLSSVEEYKLYFLELDKVLYNFIESLNSIGDIYIVTNASMSWIKTCLSILNSTRKTIIKNNIRIVSARDIYSSSNESPTKWKILSFQNIINQVIDNISVNLKKNTYLNIFSFGDATYEYDALINLDSYLKNNSKVHNKINYFLKSIKFMHKPKFNLIIEQIKMIEKNQNDIINKLDYIDLKFD